MLINDNRKAKTVPFSSIKQGEIFTDDDEDFMLKTEEIEDSHTGIYNAVNLETGAMYQLDNNAEVIRIVRASININE